MAEVEAHAVGVDHLALLGHVRAQHMAQGRVQPGGRRSGWRGCARAARRRPNRRTRSPAASRPEPILIRCDVQVAGLLLGVEHLARAAGPFDLARVAGLAAALGVEGGVVEQDLDLCAGLGRVDRRAVARGSPGSRPAASTWS